MKQLTFEDVFTVKRTLYPVMHDCTKKAIIKKHFISRKGSISVRELVRAISFVIKDEYSNLRINKGDDWRSYSWHNKEYNTIAHLCTFKFNGDEIVISSYSDYWEMKNIIETALEHINYISDFDSRAEQVAERNRRY